MDGEIAGVMEGFAAVFAIVNLSGFVAYFVKVEVTFLEENHVAIFTLKMASFYFDILFAVS